MKSERILSQLKELIEFHLTIYTALLVRDVYKLLHQGVCGSGHLLTDPDAARSYLLDEWEKMAGRPAEPVVVPVSPDHTVVRINLRSFKAAGGDVFGLWRAFYASAQTMEQDIGAFIRIWERFLECCRDEMLPFSPQDVESLTEKMAALGYPPRHHSTAYREANDPHYRVVRAEIARREQLLTEETSG
jgi:hypothetical protein